MELSYSLLCAPGGGLLPRVLRDHRVLEMKYANHALSPQQSLSSLNSFYKGFKKKHERMHDIHYKLASWVMRR